MKSVVGVIMFAAILGAASKINEHCETDDESRMTCRCVGGEEFTLPSDDYVYKNVTSLRVLHCKSAHLDMSSLSLASQITEIIVQNIRERLIFEPYVTTAMLKNLTLSQIGWIRDIKRNTFVQVHNIGSLRIENARIGLFEDLFTDTAITDFAMINVTVEQAEGLNFSKTSSGTLRIENSEFQTVTKSMSIRYFSNVEIVHSKFHLQKPSQLLVEGDRVLVEDCMFSNASMNVVATERAVIKGTCADGKSSMRLSSSKIESANNRLPTEIVYAKTSQSKEPNAQNNTVCIAGNCKCPNTSSQGTHATTIASLFAYRFLLPIGILMSSNLESFRLAF